MKFCLKQKLEKIKFWTTFILEIFRVSIWNFEFWTVKIELSFVESFCSRRSCRTPTRRRRQPPSVAARQSSPSTLHSALSLAHDLIPFSLGAFSSSTFLSLPPPVRAEQSAATGIAPAFPRHPLRFLAPQAASLRSVPAPLLLEPGRALRAGRRSRRAPWPPPSPSSPWSSPVRSSSAQTDPPTGFPTAHWSSQARARPESTTGALPPPPPAACSRGAAPSGHLSSRRDHPKVALGLYLLHLGPLATGEPPRRNLAGKHRPLLCFSAQGPCARIGTSLGGYLHSYRLKWIVLRRVLLQ